MALDPIPGGWYVRYASQDIAGTPTITTNYYTTSPTLTVGMHLYTRDGTDTGLTVASINQDGTFEVSTPSITYYAWGPYRGSYVYTTSETPIVGDKLYEYDNGSMVWSADSIAAGNIAYVNVGSITNNNGFSYDRNSSEDIVLPS